MYSCHSWLLEAGKNNFARTAIKIYRHQSSLKIEPNLLACLVLSFSSFQILKHWIINVEQHQFVSRYKKCLSGFSGPVYGCFQYERCNTLQGYINFSSQISSHCRLSKEYLAYSTRALFITSNGCLLFQAAICKL